MPLTPPCWSARGARDDPSDSVRAAWASALLKGWIAKGIGPVIVIEPKPSAALKSLAKAKTITLVAVPSAVKTKKIAACVVAIKPQMLKSEAPVLADFAKAGALMISIAAGTDTKLLFQAWGAKARIVRAMPNTPGAIGQGITGLYAAKGTTAADRKRADRCCRPWAKPSGWEAKI